MTYLDNIFKSNLAIINSQTYKEYRYTFSDFIECLNKFDLKKPIYQSDVNNDKITEMIFSYKNNPDFFLVILKNHFSLALQPQKKKYGKL